MTTVAIVVSDLLFQSRISAAVRAAGAHGVVADDAVTTTAALSLAPALVIVDLHERSIDPTAVIRSAGASGAHVLAFGRHTEPATLRAARKAGAVTVVARSQLVEDLPQLIQSLLASAKREASGSGRAVD